MNRIEKQQIKANNNGKNSGDMSANQLFEAQVDRTPDGVALICGSERFTYRELDHRANQLAHRLLAKDVGRGTLVGICAERSAEMIVGVLGILKAGAAYVPLDPTYPKERIKLMVADSRPAFVLTQSNLVEYVSEFGPPTVLLDIVSGAEGSSECEYPNVVKPSDLAYVIYTSGSTGMPKGVMITQANLGYYVRSMQSATGVNVLDKYLHTASISFSSSVRQLMLPLSVGATVVLATSIEIRDPVELFRSIKRLGVTVIDIVPSYWRSCIYALRSLSHQARADLLSNNLRLILSASEPLLSDVPRSWRFELQHNAVLMNMFGQTETTGIVATYPIEPSDEEQIHVVPVGSSINGAQIHLLDEQLKPVGQGESGEICVGGPTVGRGYLNRPDLTDERFVPDPLASDPAARLYKTGDLARFLPTGAIEYVGRIDNQVKIRGYRIELAEIEAAVSSHPDVRESVVIAMEDHPGEKKLVAYVVPEQDRNLEFSDVRTHIRRTLPDYMVPSSFVELARFPLSPNGKVDRRALPAPEPAPIEIEGRVSSPGDGLESQLARIWEEILGIESIGVGDNFFDLGGHSLQAVHMFVEVERAFGKRVPIATLFEAGTIERLADILRRDEWSEPESSLVAIQPNGTKPPFFCVHARGGNVLFYRDLARYLGPDQPFYGLQARRVGGRQVGHETVEEMAEYYINEIRTLQPNGPYFLGGASFGGLAAFEMARQLLIQGSKVALLALFDSGTPDYSKLLPRTASFRTSIDRFFNRIQFHRNSLRMLDAQERVTYLQSKVLKLRRNYRRKLNNTYKRAGRTFYSLVERPVPKSFIQIEDKIWEAYQRYVPQRYAGKATLFRASRQLPGVIPDPTLGWADLIAGGLEVHVVAGQHAAIVSEPYVKELVDKFAPCLAASQAENRFQPSRVRTA